MTSAYPLTWPDNWPRSQSRGSSQFKTSLSGALNNVQDSLRKFAADSGKKIENLVISSNVTLGMQKPQDPGVAVYFTWDGLTTCIAVDRYQKVEDNLQAIHHVLEAERTKLRHGGLNLVRAAFRGYAALPPPSSTTIRHWSAVLDVPASATVEEIKAAHRKMSQKYHPDKPGGSTERMSEINVALEQAKKEKA